MKNISKRGLTASVLLALTTVSTGALAAGQWLRSGLNTDGQVAPRRAAAEKRLPAVKVTLNRTMQQEGQDVTYDATFQNTGKSAIKLSTDQVRAQDNQGRVYWLGLGDSTLSSTLKPGQSVHSAVGFTLAKGAQLKQLYFIAAQ